MEEPMRSARPLESLSRRNAVPLLLLLAGLGCGDSSTAPTLQDVSGVYDVVAVFETSACTPAEASETLAPALIGGTEHLTLRVEDLGDRVRVTILGVENGTFDPNAPPTLAQLDPDGSISLDPVTSTDQLVIDGRTFDVETVITAVGSFERAADPITFTLAGQATLVFHEGAADAPVFATCTQPQHQTGTRRGD
jgi:hypothetical protein